MQIEDQRMKLRMDIIMQSTGQNGCNTFDNDPSKSKPNFYKIVLKALKIADIPYNL